MELYERLSRLSKASEGTLSSSARFAANLARRPVVDADPVHPTPSDQLRQIVNDVATHTGCLRTETDGGLAPNCMHSLLRRYTHAYWLQPLLHFVIRYLLKTPSSRGPGHILRTTALNSSTASARTDILLATPANVPATKRWWVLRGSIFQCFDSKESWEAGEVPKLDVNLQLYTVLDTRDPQAIPTIAVRLASSD